MTPLVRKVAELKAGYERFFGGSATIVELSQDLFEEMKKEVEPLLKYKNENSDGHTYVMGLRVVEVPGSNHMEIK